MSHLLFDILSIDAALDRSLIYLNKSISYNLENILPANIETIGEEKLSELRFKAVENKILDSPLSWFGLNILKSLSLNILVTKSQIHLAQSALNELLAPGANSLNIKIANHNVNNFKFNVPLNLNKKLQLNFDNWNTLSKESEYVRWEYLFSKSINLINTVDSSLLAEMNKLIKSLLVVRSRSSAHGSMSPKIVMGTIYLPDIEDHTLIAECLVHEGLHQYLYRIEHMYPLFIGNQGYDELYYSPWKEEPRPLIMVMHGAFVFTGVLLFYFELLKNNILVNHTEMITERMAHRVNQVKLAIEVLLANNYLTKLGVSIVEILSDYVNEVTDSVLFNEKFIFKDLIIHKQKFAKANFHHVAVR